MDDGNSNHHRVGAFRLIVCKTDAAMPPPRGGTLKDHFSDCVRGIPSLTFIISKHCV